MVGHPGFNNSSVLRDGRIASRLLRDFVMVGHLGRKFVRNSKWLVGKFHTKLLILFCPLSGLDTLVLPFIPLLTQWWFARLIENMWVC